MWGVRGGALSHTRRLVLSGVQPGPTTHWLWPRGVRAWGPVTNPTARALACWLCALWGRHEGARGGASCLGVGHLGSGALPPPTTRPFWRAAGAHCPLAGGAGGAGVLTRHQPHSARSCKLGFARCLGDSRAPEGGRLLPGCGTPGVGRSPTPDHSSFRACGRGQLPTGCGCGGCGRGNPSPTPPRALLRAGFARCGGDMGVPRGRAPLAWASGVGRSPTPDRLSFGACSQGPLPTGCGCGGCGRGTRHQPHSARSCVLAWRAVGAAQGRPGGAPLAWVWGVRGRALPQPRPLVLLGVRPEPTLYWLWVRGVRLWGPVTNPTVRALASWVCALWGRHEGARGGASCLGVGHPGSGALPPPTTRPFWRAAGAHYPLAGGAGGAGVRTRHQPHSGRPCKLGFASCLGGSRAPGGGACCQGVGRPGWALSHPRPLVLSGVRPGPTTHWLLVRGVRACGPVTNPTARALVSWLCALWGRHEGAEGEGASCLGVRGPALSQPGPPVLWGVQPGPTTNWLWVRGVWAWRPITNPTARALACWLGALWGRHERAWGGRLMPGCGASGVWRSPTPDNSSFCGCSRGPLSTGCGCGGCGRGDLSPTATRALLRARFARCGGGMRVPGGRAPLAWVPGVRRSPTPDCPSFQACGRGPLPTGGGCGGCGRGDPSRTPQRALLVPGLARCGGGTRATRGGDSCLGAGRPARALSHPRPLVLSGVRPGPATHWLWVRGVRE